MRSFRYVVSAGILFAACLVSACGSTVTVTSGGPGTPTATAAPANTPAPTNTPAATSIASSLPSSSACPTTKPQASKTFTTGDGGNVGYCFSLTDNWDLKNGFQNTSTANQEANLFTFSDPENSVTFFPSLQSPAAAGCASGVNSTCVETWCKSFITNQIHGTAGVTEGADVVKVGQLSGVGVTVDFTQHVSGFADTDFQAECNAANLGGHLFFAVLSFPNSTDPFTAEGVTIYNSLLFFHG